MSAASHPNDKVATASETVNNGRSLSRLAADLLCADVATYTQTAAINNPAAAHQLWQYSCAMMPKANGKTNLTAGYRDMADMDAMSDELLEVEGY